MPTFLVKLRQWAEEVAEVEVEADSALEAEDKARGGEIDIDWRDGDCCQDMEIVSVESVE